MTTKRIVRISYFTMLTVIGAMLRIPVPFTPISFTMQTIFVVLSGFIIGKYDGAIAQIAYMLIGLVGVPIFTNGGGFQYIFQPSFGYIFAFPIGAFIAGFLMHKRKKINSFIIFMSGFAALLSIYIIGMTYQALILAFYTGLGLKAALLTLPSILVMFAADIVMLVIICLIYPKLLTMLKLKQQTPVAGGGGSGTAAELKVAKNQKEEAAAKFKVAKKLKEEAVARLSENKNDENKAPPSVKIKTDTKTG